MIKMIEEDNKNNNESEQFKNTNKINLIKQLQPNLTSSSLKSSNTNLNDFRKVLGELENQIIEYEEETGRQQSAQRISKHETFSNYTVSLVNAVSSLFHHLKQTTFELQNEKQKFNECLKQLDIQRKLIDGLTTVI